MSQSKGQNRAIPVVMRAAFASYPILIAWIFTRVFYPGFMSYDTLYELTAARGEVTESIRPPMVSYVWRAVDFFSQDPSTMHFFQVALLLFSINGIILKLTSSIKISLGFFLVFFLVPVITGTLAVIWKDVLTTSFMLSAFALSLYIPDVRYSRSKIKLVALSALFLALIFLGITTRHNSILGAIPFIVFAVYQFLRPVKGRMKKLSLSIKVPVASLLVITALVGGKSFIDSYSIPQLRAIDGTSTFFDSTPKQDLVGASVCANFNYLSEIAPSLTLEEVKMTYDPRHVNRYGSLLSEISSGEAAFEKWLSVLAEDPWCLLSWLADLFIWLFWLNLGEQFLLTAPSVDQNDFGYKLEPSYLRDTLVNNMVTLSYVHLVRPWFLGLVSIILLLYLVIRRRVTLPLLALFSSGALYALGLIALGNAADARLLFHTNVISILVTFIALHELRSWKKNRSPHKASEPAR